MPTGTDAIVTAKPKDYTGGFYVGDYGTTLPTPGPTAFAPLDASMDSMGLVGPEGFTKNSSASDEDEYAWGGIVVNTNRNEFGVTYDTVLREVKNVTVLQRIFGEANVVVTAPTATEPGVVTVLSTPDTAPRQSVVFEMLDRGYGHREVIENAQILTQGEQQFTHSASLTIPVQIKAYPGNTKINGKTVNSYNMKETDPATGV